MNRTDNVAVSDEAPVKQPPGWYVLPKTGGGWRVHDGGTPEPAAIFDRKTDAIAFARHQSACPCASGGVRKRVVIFNRPRKVSPDELRALRALDLTTPRPGPRRPGSARGMLWMADDFDELPAELAEFFE